MNWNRGGQQQRAKVQEQYVMMGPNPGLTIMMKNGFVIGKGLGDGKGRLGAPWGLQGRLVRSHKPQGLKTPTQGNTRGATVESAQERTRKIGKRGEASRRHPKVLVLTINLLIEDKTNKRPRLEDHYIIMKQAGLNLAKVKGKVGKIGYLEVALEPGAASAAGALREVSKIVDDRITILSVREQGSNREVLVKWHEVPFGILDETLYSYLELFSNPVRSGRNLWWEVCKEEDDQSPSGEMAGKWTGERTLMVTLKPGACAELNTLLHSGHSLALEKCVSGCLVSICCFS